MLLAYRGTFAVLSAVNGNKLELRLADGASRSVRPKDVEFLHEGPIVKVDFTPHFPEPDEALIAGLLDEQTDLIVIRPSRLDRLSQVAALQNRFDCQLMFCRYGQLLV